MARARAMPTRWRWPPESSCGKRPSSGASRPTWSEKLGDAGGGRRSAQAAGGDGFAQDGADALARVQRGMGVLEHHLHAAPVSCVRALTDKPASVGAVPLDSAAGRGQQADDHLCQGGFAAAAFADQPEDVAALDRQGNAIHGGDDRSTPRRRSIRPRRRR